MREYLQRKEKERKRQKLKQLYRSLSSGCEYLLSHTQTRTLLAVLRQLLIYTTHYSRFFCTHLLATLHYLYLADADQRSAASFSRVPNAGDRDASRHPVHPRAARARELIELLACHAGWLRHTASCTTLLATTAIGSTFSKHARTHIHTYIQIQ